MLCLTLNQQEQLMQLYLVRGQKKYVLKSPQQIDNQTAELKDLANIPS